MIVLNELFIGKADYSTIKEFTKMITTQEYGLPEVFFGGTAQYIGYIKESPVMQILNNDTGEFEVLSVAIENWSDLNFFQLKSIALQKNMENVETAKKEEIMDFLRDNGSIVIVEKGDPVKKELTIDLREV